jgi:hypothetical protein
VADGREGEAAAGVNEVDDVDDRSGERPGADEEALCAMLLLLMTTRWLGDTPSCAGRV